MVDADTIYHLQGNSDQVIELDTETKVTKMVTFRTRLHWTISRYFDWVGTSQEFEYSPLFNIDLGQNKEPCTFCLKIYPKGERIRCLLENQNKHDIVADYEHYLVKKDGSHLKIISEEKWNFKQYAARGTKKGIKLSVLKQHQDEFFPNGGLTIGSLITIRIPESDIARSSLLEANAKKQETMMECFIKSYDIAKPENVSNYEKLSDFTILCGKNSESSFKCHKLFLSLRSRVFEKMFAHNTAENTTNMVIIPDISPQVIQNMLNFMYTDDVKEEMINKELLYAADKYEVDRLKAICEKVLASQMTVSTAIDISISAHMQGSKMFQEETIRYIAKNWGKIKTNKDYEKIKQYPDLLMEIIAKL